MIRRKSMKRKTDRKVFRKTAGRNKRNTTSMARRGGFRI